MIRATALAFLLLAPIASGSGTRPPALAPPEELVLPALPPTPEVPLLDAPADFAPLVAAAAEEAGVPAWILGRILAAESGWSATALGINEDGSRDLGIAQLGERWLADFAWFDNAGQAFDPFLPAEAIPVAARYLARLYRAVGSWPAAVAAYNCGLSRVRGGDIPGRTLAYVAKILEE